MSVQWDTLINDVNQSVAKRINISFTLVSESYVLLYYEKNVYMLFI
jgi:hypothetical protein